MWDKEGARWAYARYHTSQRIAKGVYRTALGTADPKVREQYLFTPLSEILLLRQIYHLVWKTMEKDE